MSQSLYRDKVPEELRDSPGSHQRPLSGLWRLSALPLRQWPAQRQTLQICFYCMYTGHNYWNMHVAYFTGTQDWEFFWLRFWNLRYFFVSYVKILRFYKKNFLIGPLLGEVRFFRVVLGLRRMKKNFELGQNF